jgi:hypothetical protein
MGMGYFGRTVARVFATRPQNGLRRGNRAIIKRACKRRVHLHVEIGGKTGRWYSNHQTESSVKREPERRPGGEDQKEGSLLSRKHRHVPSQIGPVELEAEFHSTCWSDRRACGRGSIGLIIMAASVEWPPTPIESEHLFLVLCAELTWRTVLQFIGAVHDAGGGTEIYYNDHDPMWYPIRCKKMRVGVWNAYLPMVFKTLLQMNDWISVDVYADQEFSAVLTSILMDANAQEMTVLRAPREAVDDDAARHARHHKLLFCVGAMVVVLHIIGPSVNRATCELDLLLETAGDHDSSGDDSSGSDMSDSDTGAVG